MIVDPQPMNQRRRGVSPLLVVVVITLVAVGVTAVMLAGPVGNAGAGNSVDLHTITEGSFDIVIPTSGEVLAQQQREIRNELEVRAVISEIVDEGTYVNAGDVLMRLNDEQIREQIRSQQDIVVSARNSLASAEANLAIRRSEASSQLATADLNIRLAELSLHAWEEGTDISMRQTLQQSLETSQKNYDRYVARFEAAKNLLAREFISLDEYRQDEIEMIRAKARLEEARLSITVYEEYDAIRDKADLTSKLVQEREERDRLELRTKSEIESAVSDVDSRRFQLENAEARLTKLERQLAACTVKAPTEGLVIYASSIESGNNWGRDEDPPQVGTNLSRNQLVMILPDTSRLVAEVKIGEAQSNQVVQGQRAAVTSESAGDRIFPGVVQSVAVMAQAQNWRGPNRRDYTVRILLDGNGNDLGIKPSQRCDAVIFVGSVDDSTFAPVQAVHQSGEGPIVFAERDGLFEPRPVTVGQSSELFVQITSGLQPGDRVLLRQPGPNELLGSPPQALDESIESDATPGMGAPGMAAEPHGQASAVHGVEAEASAGGANEPGHDTEAETTESSAAPVPGTP